MAGQIPRVLLQCEVIIFSLSRLLAFPPGPAVRSTSQLPGPGPCFPASPPHPPTAGTGRRAQSESPLPARQGCAPFPAGTNRGNG